MRISEGIKSGRLASTSSTARYLMREHASLPLSLPLSPSLSLSLPPSLPPSLALSLSPSVAAGLGLVSCRAYVPGYSKSMSDTVKFS